MIAMLAIAEPTENTTLTNFASRECSDGLSFERKCYSIL
jgi:hypothetical protein